VAEGFAKSHDLWLELAIINQLRGGVYFFRSDYEICLEVSAISLEYAREAGSPEVEARALSALGDAEYSHGRYLSASRYFNQCIEIARKNGFGRVIAANLIMRALVSWHDNNFESANADSLEAIELAVKTRHARAEMIVLIVYVYLNQENDDLIECEEMARRALSISRRLGSRLFEGESLYTLSKVMFLQGNNTEAYKLALKSLDICRASDSGMVYMGPLVLGQLALVTNDPDQCHMALMEAEALLNGGSVSHNHFLFYESAMEICLRMAAWDEVDRYAQALQDYVAAEPLRRNSFFIARGRALANHGR